jgi:hypothetical protein
MAKPKVDLEIRKAKVALEQEISNTLHIITQNFHDAYPGWSVTDADLGIIDLSTVKEQKTMTAASRVELTRKDRTMKITKGGKVKNV